MQLALRLIAHLPLSFLHALGSVLGWTIYGMSPTYRRHLRENLAAAELSLPDEAMAALDRIGTV